MEIDGALVARTRLVDIVSRFGHSTTALSNHHREHLGAALVRAVARVVAPPPSTAEIAAYENSLLGEMRALQARTMKLLEDAENSPDLRLRAVVIAQIRENVVALAKLMPANVREEVVAIEFSFTDPPRLLSQGRDAAIAASVEAVSEQPDAIAAAPAGNVGTEKTGTEAEPSPFAEPLDWTFTHDGRIVRGPR